MRLEMERQQSERFAGFYQRKFYPWQTAFLANLEHPRSDPDDGVEEAAPSDAPKITSLHPEPKNFYDLAGHPYEEEFRKTMADHVKEHQDDFACGRSSVC